MLYSPAAAMFTEQKPPCAAQLGVPYCCAHNPVSACIWSRPVKNASFFGSVARRCARRLVNSSSASSHEMGSKMPSPRSVPGRRIIGCCSFALEYCFMMPALPFAQSTPWFTM